VLSRVLAGAHLSLAIGFGALLISLVCGVPYGPALSRPPAARRKRCHGASDADFPSPILLGC